MSEIAETQGGYAGTGCLLVLCRWTINVIIHCVLVGRIITDIIQIC